MTSSGSNIFLIGQLPKVMPNCLCNAHGSGGFGNLYLLIIHYWFGEHNGPDDNSVLQKQSGVMDIINAYRLQYISMYVTDL